MSRFWLNLIVTVAVAGAAGFLGARVGATGFAAPPSQTPFLRASVEEMVRSGLALTRDQMREIEAIEARYTQRRNALRVQISHANLGLAEAMSEEMAFGPQAQTAIDHLQASVGELQSSTVLYMLEVRDVLTPEQRTVFDRKVVETLTRGLL